MLYPQVTRVVPLDGKRIKITFETGETKLFDVTPYIKGSWCGMLADEDYFKQVRPAGRTVVWPDGQDIGPDDLEELGVPL